MVSVGPETPWIDSCELRQCGTCFALFELELELKLELQLEVEPELPKGLYFCSKRTRFLL
jgi:hypothetical protein